VQSCEVLPFECNACYQCNKYVHDESAKNSEDACLSRCKPRYIGRALAGVSGVRRGFVVCGGLFVLLHNHTQHAHQSGQLASSAAEDCILVAQMP
jgi:hypothetical protein